jgi:RNA-binding protein YlmH
MLRILCVQEMVEAGDVMINWKETKSPAALLREGDLVTVRGKGRLEIEKVEVTSKERFRVKMTKYI